MSPDRHLAAPFANFPAKRTLQTITYTRKLQPKSPSRKRLRIDESAAPLREVVVDRKEAALSVLDEASSSSSCFASEVTFESGAFFSGSKHPRKLTGSVSHHNKVDIAVRGHPSEEFRRITRSYAKQKKKLREAEEEGNGGGVFTFLPDPLDEGRNAKHTNFSLLKTEHSAENAFSGVTTSDVSHISGDFNYVDPKRATGTRKGGYEAPEISDSSCHESVSVVDTREFPTLSDPRTLEECDPERDAELACLEHLSNSVASPDISSCRELRLSELGSDILRYGSGGEFSGHSSLVFESSDDCLERSRENSTLSFFPLFLRLGSEFRSSSHEATSGLRGEEYAHEFTLMRFEDRDDEESYQRFRSRERKQALLHDYTEEYSSKTEYGDLIIEQRLHANAEDLQCETLFLGVGLMDRFLSRGFFKTEGNLQLLGIACVTLATRMEENRPYNCVRRKSFYVRGNTYSRCEIVAMEWFIQEVLNFQCLHLTTFNFLWFYLKAAQADEAVEKLAKYLAVLSLLDHERLSFWPSSVAAGLVILASLATDHDSSCNWVMETHVRTKNDDLSECMQSLEWLVKYAC